MNLKPPPIFYLAVFVIVGIILVEFLRIPLIFTSLSFLLILSAYFFALKMNFRYKFILACFLFFLLGFFLASSLLCSLKNGLLPALARQSAHVEVSGVVAEESKKLNETVSLILKANRVKSNSEEWCLSERLKVYVRGSRANDFQIGDRIIFKGKLSFPENKDEFNYIRYLSHQRIKTVAFIDFSQIEEVKKSENVFLNFIKLIRLKTGESLARFLPGDKGAVVLGMLLGNTSKISEETLENFRTTGLSHVLAVSGLHVGILIVACGWLMYLLKVKPVFQGFLILLAVSFYSVLTLGRPSILRALLMTVAGLIAWYSGRENNLLSSISFACLVLLVYDPFILYDIGFQLSFAATLGVIFLNPILGDWMSEIPRGLGKNVALCLSAQLGVAPFLLCYFKSVSQVSVLANLLVVPLLAPLLISGMVVSFASVTLSFLVQPVCLIINPIISYVLWIAKALGNLTRGVFYFHFSSVFMFIGYYSILFAGAKAIKFYKPKIDFQRLIILFLFVAAIFTWSQALKSPVPETLRVTFLDVGQGDSILVQTPEGANILIDGGESSSALKLELQKRGIREIDVLVLSHPHADHVGGLVWVAKNLKIEMVLDSGQSHTLYQYKEFLQNIDKRGIEYKVVRRKDKFLIGDTLKLEVFHPQESLISGSRSDLNNNSVVLKLTYGEFDLLFPGDIEEEAETLICDLDENIEVEVLKVPHHGSASGMSLEFLKKVSPEIAIISVGEGNRYGHPAKSTINRLKKFGVDLYRTDKNGTVTVVSDGKSFEVTTEK